MKILLAVDGSEDSLAAAEVIASRPWPPESAVRILSVVRLPFTPTAETRSLPESDYSRLESAAMQQAQEAVDQALARASVGASERQFPLTVTTEILQGQQQEVILALAEEWGAELIMLGSRGLSGVRRFLLGSVSSAVATHARCSVEVVRVDESHPVRQSQMKILLAVDGSRGSEAAVSEVAGRPWPTNSTVKIISVAESPQPLSPASWALPRDYYEQWEQSLTAQAHGAVEQAVARFQQTAGHNLAIVSEVIPGGAREVILDEADKWGADLIVLGSRGLGGVARLLLGSVSSAALAHARCSVEIARPRQKVAGGQP
jgi:nucleotide-binding universal stress UspA family protein